MTCSVWLIDMAEVWELYVYHLLRSALRGVEVVHTGRDLRGSDYLISSDRTGERLGSLRPDILIRAAHTNRLLAILDAKYKTTKQTPERPHGVQREDLYQLAAYLSAYGSQSELVSGGLIYPATEHTTNIIALETKSPWRFSASGRPLWFFGIRCETDSSNNMQLSEGEVSFMKAIQNALEQHQIVELIA